MEWRALLGRSRGLGTGRTETQRPSLPPSGMTYLPRGPEILVVESPWRRCGGGDGQGTGLLLTWYGWGDVLSGLCLERPSPLPSSTHTHLYFPWSERDPSPPPSTGVGDTQHLCSKWCVMRLISLTPRLTAPQLIRLHPPPLQPIKCSPVPQPIKLQSPVSHPIRWRPLPSQSCLTHRKSDTPSLLLQQLDATFCSSAN